MTKRMLLLLSFPALLLTSCGGEAPKESAEDQTAEVIDTVAIKLEETKKEIEKSAEEVDELLKDL